MSRLDFHIEFHSGQLNLRDELKTEAETRLRALAEGRSDLIGASVAVQELAREETLHFFQARVVVYIRPHNIVGIEKAESAENALKGALESVERQIRQRRERFRTPWQPPAEGDTGVYQLSPREIYDTYTGFLPAPETLLDMERDAIATELMTRGKLDQAAAYYATDEILVFAQEVLERE